MDAPAEIYDSTFYKPKNLNNLRAWAIIKQTFMVKE